MFVGVQDGGRGVDSPQKRHVYCLITAEPRANLIRPEIDECKHRATDRRASEDQEKAGMDSLDRYEAEDTPLNRPQFIRYSHLRMPS